MGATVIPQTLADVWTAVASQALGGVLGGAPGRKLAGPVGPRPSRGLHFPRVRVLLERASASQASVGDTALG